MHTLYEIERMSREAGEQAAAKNNEPLMAFCNQDMSVMNCPNLGDYRPKGWKLLDKLFVDNSGFGREGEPALTVEQFISKVKEGLGYAVIESGQFQVYIGVFEKIT